MSPWNFALAMLVWKIGPGTGYQQLAGDQAPELASLTTLRLAKLAHQAGVPAGVFNIVSGLGHFAGKALGLHMDVDMVTFTGSTEVGRAFLRYSADSNLKGIVLADAPLRRRRQMLALPAFHCSHGMFQSPSPSVPGNAEPTVLTTSTMSPRLLLS
jgi:Aldehyde dehydrogenase family